MNAVPVRSRLLVIAASTAALTLTACSAVGGDDDSDSAADGGGETVVLLTHDSFSLPDEVVAAFEEESGYTLETRANGDAGELTNKLVLSAGNPQGDAAFGVDNTFGGRAVAEDVFAGYEAELPAGAEDFLLPGDDDQDLTPVDTGNVCVNIDETYFAENNLTPPETLDDLLEEQYRGLFVTPGAPTSSPGLAFLLSTVAEYGDAWPLWWEQMVENDMLVVAGWTDAYQVEFTQGGGGGDRPIVLSYDSSPAFTIADDGTTTTSALLDTCFRQVEYVGVLEGAENPEGAQALVDFMLTEDVQAALPDSMFVFPVVDGVELPTDWAEFAERPDESLSVDPVEIEENREEWLTQWSDITS